MSIITLYLSFVIGIHSNCQSYQEDIKAMVDTASIIEGEAGTCGLPGMIAIANVYERNQTMYAKQSPTQAAIQVAMLAHYNRLPDITGGATHVFSLSDLRLTQVKRITGGKKPNVVIRCNDGKMALNLY